MSNTTDQESICSTFPIFFSSRSVSVYHIIHIYQFVIKGSSNYICRISGGCSTLLLLLLFGNEAGYGYGSRNLWTLNLSYTILISISWRGTGWKRSAVRCFQCFVTWYVCISQQRYVNIVDIMTFLWLCMLQLQLKSRLKKLREKIVCKAKEYCIVWAKVRRFLSSSRQCSDSPWNVSSASV